jgi:nucleotide-binding universal stress UspA family protein
MAFETILVPEHTAEFALPVAARLAQSSHAVLRVANPPHVLAGLVVAARHGHEAVEGFWVDRETEYLMRHGDAPVLLVSPEEAGSAAAPCGLRSILVALDLSANAEAILEPVIGLTNLSDGHVTLVHVLDPARQRFEQRQAKAQQWLDRVADRLRLRGVSVSTRLLTESSAVQGLLGEFEKRRYDLIALTTHGQGGMQQLFLGSVAESLVRRARKPVLLVRPAFDALYRP